MKNTSDQNLNIPSASSNVTPSSSNQTPKKRSPKEKSNKETGSSTSSRPKPDSDTPQTCTECGKQFGSLKALYGHMRCHPERQWRGINPPSSLNASEEENDVASSLLMLAKGDGGSTDSSGFQCSGCKKVFGSHQALGGHRASHKHVKGCFTMTNLTEEDPPPPPPQEIVEQEDKKSKNVKLVSGTNHRCNICFRVFSSGQALGGHMRCHSGRDQGENKDGDIDLNVPTETSSDPSLGSSLDLNLGL